MNQLVEVRRVSDGIINQITLSVSHDTWKQYWMSKTLIVWCETDLFRCPICKRMFYKRDVKIVTVKMTSVCVAPKSYVPAAAEEQDKLYLAPLCPTCAKEFEHEWKINKNLLVLLLQK